jgi:DNA-binding NarL/FixJ family response regulator
MATRQQGPALGAPPGLVVETFTLGPEAFALLSWPRSRPGQLPALGRVEREVLDLLLAGLSNAAISRRRGRSVRTVAHQVDTLYRRFGVHSRQELMALHCRGTT